MDLAALLFEHLGLCQSSMSWRLASPAVRWTGVAERGQPGRPGWLDSSHSYGPAVDVESVGHPTVDGDGLARDEAGGVGSKKHNHVGNIVGLGPSAQGCLVFDRLDHPRDRLV